ncbi:MAG: LacI family DNA-binding transcriptional regulator [Marmoricola sp.]
MGPTQEDVARRANVSRALVSLVLRDAPNVSAQSREKVLRAANELGYRPNAFARSLASKQVHTLGVLINDVTNPYFAAVYSSFATAAEAAGYDLLVAPGVRSAGKEGPLVNTLLEHRVAGLALLSPIMRTDTLREICTASPTVVIGRDVSFVENVDVVTTDERQAAKEVIAHLTDLGHTQIAHITGGANRSAHDREAAYVSTMREHQLQPLAVPGDFTEEGGKRGAAHLLRSKQRPTAVIAANDLCAVGAIGEFSRHGLSVPEEVSVVGYDDSQIAGLAMVQLTSVRQSIEQFGASALSMLIERIADPDIATRANRMPTELVVRTTTAMCQPAGANT